MELTTKIPEKRIAELLCSGFEGGMTRHWCRVMDTVEPKESKRFMDEQEDYPLYDYPLTEGGQVVCRLYEEETDEKFNPLVLNLEAITKGLQIMQEKFPRHFGDFLAENDDSITGDVFIQLCLLGDLVYG